MQPSVKNQAQIPSDSLLRGAFYAVEHAWKFLLDAVLLFQNQRFSNALVLATYCLEEVGRARIYLRHRVDGDAVTARSLKDECKDHAFKLTEAKIPVSVSFSGMGEPPVAGSREERELFERFRSMRDRLEKQIPDKAKSQRFAALYVGPEEDGIRWNRPSHVTRDEAEHWLSPAYVAYLLVRNEVLSAASPEELDRAFWGWPHQPSLPEADWDIFDWDSARPPVSSEPS